ncbi:Cytochrome P450 monooxygenase calL-like protein [Cladobotryum mycophilum]|uniref:Cytochrome P450 monooxygenase calL-like protein n=1 Tax=Cladobotryum mycophilum TaxID=491253 RepID=A0ABR0SZ63_9HYPO
MLSDSVQAALELSTREILFNFLPLLAFGTALLCWRLWRFTIVPLMNPLAPEELPYWIPWHAYSFFKDYNEAIDKGRKHFNGSNMPFSVSIAGARLYICSAPEDVASLYRNTTTISYQNVIKDMYRWIGVSEDGFEKMFTLDQSSKHNIGMAHPQAPSIMINEHHRRQTKPGELFNDLLHKRTIPGIDRSFQAIVNRSSSSVIGASTDSATVSLLGLCTDLFLRGTTTAFLGQKIWEVNPKLLDSFAVWERTNWKYMFQMPEFISGDMVQARNAIINTFVDYLAIPAAERSDCNDFVKSIETMMRDLGVDEKDMAKIFMLHFWAILGNIYKVAFWTIAHLVYDPYLLDSIRAEVTPAIKDRQLDESYLVEKCPLLESLLSEVLRLTVATALVRDVVAPTHIRGKTLQPGSKILVPYRQLHQNRSVWGEDPLTLAPARFVDEPKLSSSKSYRPFGGGHTLCPGRFFAKRAMGYAIAAMVTRFELSLDVEMTRKAVGGDGKSARFPRMDSTKPSPGASLPHKGEDVFLVLKEKKTVG